MEMKSTLMLTVGLAVSGAALALAQAPAPANLQAPQAPGYAEVIAKCKTPPQGGAAAGGARAGGAAAPAAAAAPAPGSPSEYEIVAIPGVIAAGHRWELVYSTTGNNADGIIASEDGGVLLAQNDNGTVLKLDRSHQPSVVHRDTNTGGALAMSSKGTLFIASRGLGTAIWQLAPERRLFVNRFQGEPLECLGGVLNDLTADSKGGVYFTMGGVFYADPTGTVTRYGENLRTNGVILSPDEKTLYVTNGAVVVAFDVRPDGSLANQRDFVKLPSGGGDGMAVDAAGRLYITSGGGGGGTPGVHVAAPDGKLLGTIAGPRNFITVGFGGPDKKTLYAVANDRRIVEVYALPVLAQGNPKRAK
jgi:gluconolactonase